MTTRFPALLLTLSLLAAGCTVTASIDTEDDEIAVERVRLEEVAAMNDGDAEAVLALCTGDVVFMPTDQPPIAGREAVGEWLSAFFAQATVSVSNTTESVTVSGDWAIESWTALLTVNVGEDEPLTNRIKGIYIYRRNEDGAWKIARAIWNLNKPEPRL